MKKPIIILVNASVYDITLSVSYCLSNGETMTAIKNKENIIDFGKVKIISNRFKIKFNSLTSCSYESFIFHRWISSENNFYFEYNVQEKKMKR